MTTHDVALERQHELAEFLRNRRARVSPEQAGVPRGSRRRTPGLRRGEVALLAGISPEWYTWLEQGRDINVSMQVLERLAGVLQLDGNERAHLFVLASGQPPVERLLPPMISPIIRQFLDLQRTTPVCVLDVRLNVVAFNAVHRAVFGEYDGPSERDRNLIWRLFTSLARQRNEGWEEVARVYVAQFRAEYGRFIDDPWWAPEIAELNRVSPEFRELWACHDVLNVSEGRKTLHHPLAGELSFNFLWLQTIDSSDLRLLIHTPRPTTGTAQKIERLLARATVVDVEESS